MSAATPLSVSDARDQLTPITNRGRFGGYFASSARAVIPITAL